MFFFFIIIVSIPFSYVNLNLSQFILLFIITSINLISNKEKRIIKDIENI